MKAFNLFDGELDDRAHRAGRLHVARSSARAEAGWDEARREPLRAPARRALLPYHYEYGCRSGWWSLPAGRRCETRRASTSCAPGDVVCFPEGPEGAHLVRNDTDEPVRVLIASTKGDPNSAVYPDSGKIGIWTGNDADPPRLFQIGERRRLLGRREPRNANDPAGRRGVVSCGVAGFRSCGGADERGPVLRPAF